MSGVACVWQRKSSKYSPDAIVFSVHPYYDDYEPNNRLGPHCDKLGAAYLLLPFLPPECQSKVENILLALLFNTEDRVSYGNEAVFKPLIKVLRKLEEKGISVETAQGLLQIFFVTRVLLGDNLNGICGFVECFVANFMCRLCNVHRIDMGFLYEENPNLTRTRESYLGDVRANGSARTDEGVSHYVMIPVIPYDSEDTRILSLYSA
ncbi:Na(+)/H(+) antiporter [Frankliniella fusca]|uniref:Na(+)/H(+) antiporter n=1 Tax=Frankliniella fusca TaxID=407009 RepID=A0AAE1HIW5_9NEOP|nr:Na(+)/H(+) antiporter [Frankliniella fusca]